MLNDQPQPEIARSAVILGEIHVGAGAILAQGLVVRAHGAAVSIGNYSAILENGVVIGPGAMIHGCHIGRGSIVEPGAIVCDGSATGAESVVRAGACVKQRDRFGDRSILDGFPARLVGTLTGPPPVPGWALPPDAVATLRKVHR